MAIQQVKPFYAPISAGSMAHTGAVPQSYVSYQTISAQPGSHIVGVQQTSSLRVPSKIPIANPIKVGQGRLPVSVTPIHYPRPSVNNTFTKPNYFEHPNV